MAREHTASVKLRKRPLWRRWLALVAASILLVAGIGLCIVAQRPWPGIRSGVVISTQRETHQVSWRAEPEGLRILHEKGELYGIAYSEWYLRLGFCSISRRTKLQGVERSVFARWWVVLGFLVVLVALSIRDLAAGMRLRRIAGRCCERCGYDLRATPTAGGTLLERCPECGTETAVVIG